MRPLASGVGGLVSATTIGIAASGKAAIAVQAASAGSTSSQMTFFLATELEKVGAGGGDEHEDITVHVVPLAGCWDWLLGQQALGKALDPKIMAGLWFAEHLL